MTDIRDDSMTSVSLILRVGRSPTDQAAWSVFVARYRPKVFAWACAWGLRSADAEDMTQAVLVKLSRQMGRFSYDSSRSFRGWLRTLARNAWHDSTSRKRPPAGGGAENQASLENVEAREDLVRRLAETFDLEVLVEATHRARDRVAEKTWEAYRMTTLEDRPTGEVAEMLGMTVSGVFKAKSNVLRLIREEVQALEAEPSTRPNDDPAP